MTSPSISQNLVFEEYPAFISDDNKSTEKRSIDPSNITSDKIEVEKLQSSLNSTPPKTHQSSSSPLNSTPPKSTQKLDSHKDQNPTKNKNSKMHYNTDKILTCTKSKVSIPNEGTAQLEINFSSLNLKFGTDIITNHENNLNDNPEKLKTFLDFTMTSIAKNNIDEFRLIMDLNDKKIFLIRYSSTTNSAKKGQRQAYVPMGDSLTKKLQNLLAGKSSTLEFLYYINQNINQNSDENEINSDENQIWMGGVWSRSPRNNKIPQTDPALKMIITAFDKNTRLKNEIDVKSEDSNDFKKDIMEMWSNWNDGQKYNYCYGILRALHSMGIKKSPGLYLKWNRGRRLRTQSQELNHLHVIVEEKEDLRKMNPLLHGYRNRLEKESLFPQKRLSSLETNSPFSANEEGFIQFTEKDIMEI